MNLIQSIVSRISISGVRKSTGLGVSEFMLRIMGWLCTSTELYKNSITQMVIVTGPNQDLAIKLIKRLKAIFERKLRINIQQQRDSIRTQWCRDTGLSFQ